MQKGEKKLKFGVLINDHFLEKWQYNALQLLIKEGHQLNLFVSPSPCNTRAQARIYKIINYPYAKSIFRVYWRFIFKCNAKERVDISGLVNDTVSIEVKVKSKGIRQFFEQRDIKRIQDEKLDFIIRFGFGILDGDILESAKHGIWSYHHGDEKDFRGGPPGFWEIFFNRNTTSAMLQQLTSKLDGGIILHQGKFATVKHSYEEQLDTLLNSSANWLTLVANKVNANAQVNIESNPGKSLNKVPKNVKMIIFLFKVLRNKIRFHLSHLFKHEKWNVGFVEEVISNYDKPNLNKVVWMPEKKGYYFADPFLTDLDNITHVFFELFSYKTGKASLAVSTVQEVLKGMYTEIWNNNTHASFPSVIRSGDFVYLLPENYNSNGVDLYRYHNTNHSLQHHKRLIDNVEIVDPILFEKDEVWYLFCTHKKQSSTELSIYYSLNGIDGDFNSHPQNPVVTSITKSRPAGDLYYSGDKLYRPAQNCATTYGASVTLNEVTELSIHNYSEVAVASIKPNGNDKYPNGLHTVNRCGNTIAIDGKRYTFSFNYFIHLLKAKFKTRA